MRRVIGLVAVLLIVTSGFARVHKDSYSVSCNTLWPVVKDTIKNSGKYAIVGIDNGEMTASFKAGAGRNDSVVLNPKGERCEMQFQTIYDTFPHLDDAGPFKKRVDEALAKQQGSTSAAGSNTAPPAQDPAKK